MFLIEDRAGPRHTPSFEALARVTGVTVPLGGITPIRVADPERYGHYITVDKIRGQAGLPGATLEFRDTRDVSSVLELAQKGCPIDLQVHIGLCKDPSDFDLGWEKILVMEDADFTNYALPALGAFDADQEAPVMETLDLVGSSVYEIGRLAFSSIGESQIVQEVIAVVICDSKSCGECGIPSNGCERVFAVQLSAGASPGLAAEVISSQDGGSTWQEQKITTLAVNHAPTAAACVGPYLVVTSNANGAYHYALVTDLLADTQAWTKVTTGIVGAPNKIFSLGRTKTWIVGDTGYIYFTADPTAGLTVQTAGDVTAQNLTAIHGLDEENLLAVGAANAILVTHNGGTTWSLVAGPTGQAAVAAKAVWMLSELEWFVGYADGKLFYTADGGANWTQKAVPGSLTVIDDIKFASRTVGYIAGHTATVAKILRTLSGGYSWYVLPEDTGLTVPTATVFNSIAACEDSVNVVYAGGVKTASGDGILVKGA